MWWKNELLLVLWQLSMSGFSLKLFVCCSIPVMMFVISYMHDYACYVSCILVHSLYQLIQTNLTWAAQCWTILGQTKVFKWFIAQNMNTDNIPASWHHMNGDWRLSSTDGSAHSLLIEDWPALVHVKQSISALKSVLKPLPMLTCICTLLWFWLQWGGHMISMKARRETTVTTSNRFQQSGRWSANFSIKPLLISIIL